MPYPSLVFVFYRLYEDAERGLDACHNHTHFAVPPKLSKCLDLWSFPIAVRVYLSEIKRFSVVPGTFLGLLPYLTLSTAININRIYLHLVETTIFGLG